MFCKNEFLCQGEDNLCIPTSWVCDGVTDCYGAEDEHIDNCGNYFDLFICLTLFQCTQSNIHVFHFYLLGTRTCQHDELQCGGGKPVCVPSSAVCNRIHDCENGTDEDSKLCSER